MPKCILGLQEALVALLPQAAPVTLHCVPNLNEGNLLFEIYIIHTEHSPSACIGVASRWMAAI